MGTQGMVTLVMAAPWRDQKTGMFYLRRRVPAALRSVAGRDLVKWSLGTRDPKEARRLWPAALERWEGMVAAWEREAKAIVATPETAERIAAEWAAWAKDSGTIVADGQASDIFEPLSLSEARNPAGRVRMDEVVERHADDALRVANTAVTPESRSVLLTALTPVVAAAYLEADMRALGVEGGNPVLNPLEQAATALPAVATRPKAARGDKAAPLRDLFAAYKAVATVKPNVLRETEYAIEALIKFVGTDDAAKIARADLIRWRETMKAEGRSNNTWNNRHSLIGQVFARAVADEKLPVNPTDGLRLPKAKTKERFPYTDEEATKILKASRSEERPSRRWAHWIMAFTGMRVGEVLQLDAADIRQEGDIWHFEVEEHSEGKTVKNGQRRRVPVHKALVAEGLIAYAQGLPPGSPLFPDKRADAFGNRGGKGWQVVGRWVRDTVGITDKKKAPNHSWRHRIEDELRTASVSEDIRDAIAGHARKTTGRQYGIRGEALRRLDEAIQSIPVPPGI